MLFCGARQVSFTSDPRRLDVRVPKGYNCTLNMLETVSQYESNCVRAWAFYHHNLAYNPTKSTSKSSGSESLCI